MPPLLRALLLAALLLAPLAQAAPEYPDPGRVPRYHDSPCFERFDRRFVHDYVGLVPDDLGALVEGAACDVYNATSAHFVLVTVQDTGGEPLENYALHLFERWGIGERSANDGLLLLYVRDYTAEGGGGAVRVEVGYGLEAVVNAVVSRDAIDEMVDAKRRALDAGRDEAFATAYALGTGSLYLLETLASQYVDGRFPEPQPARPSFAPPVFWIVSILLVVGLVWLLGVSVEDRPGRPGWGYRRHRDAWARGLGLVLAASMRRGGGGGGLGGGGGFGGGRSGGGGGRGRL